MAGHVKNRIWPGRLSSIGISGYAIPPALLQELLEVAAQGVPVEEDYVIIKHAYVERRPSPLNIYAREANKEAARAGIIDYGNVVKDLIKSKIFPGDLRVKNLG